MSNRYEAIQALLEDPLNTACFLKAWTNKSLNLVGPKTKAASGEVWGWMLFRDLLKLPEGAVPNESQFVVSIFYDGRHWFAILPGQEEVGPFETEASAEAVILDLCRNRNWTVLSEIPW